MMMGQLNLGPSKPTFDDMAGSGWSAQILIKCSDTHELGKSCYQ